MTLAAWYIQRAVPWAALLGCLALAAAIIYPARHWELFGLEGIFVFSLTCGAAGLCFDEPAIEIASVTPRANRWAKLARLATATVPFAAGCAFTAAIGGPVPASDSLLVAISLTACVALLAMVSSRARPGAPLLATVALASLMAELAGRGSGIGSPFPNSDVLAHATLDPTQHTWWLALLVLSATVLAAAILRPNIFTKR